MEDETNYQRELSIKISQQNRYLDRIATALEKIANGSNQQALPDPQHGSAVRPAVSSALELFGRKS